MAQISTAVSTVVKTLVGCLNHHNTSSSGSADILYNLCCKNVVHTMLHTHDITKRYRCGCYVLVLHRYNCLWLVHEVMVCDVCLDLFWQLASDHSISRLCPLYLPEAVNVAYLYISADTHTYVLDCCLQQCWTIGWLMSELTNPNI